MSSLGRKSFKQVLQECAARDKYVETCRRIAGRKNYDPDVLASLWRSLRTLPGRYLTQSDLMEIFDPAKTHFGYYWKVPEGVDLAGTRISLSQARLEGNAKGLEGRRRNLVMEVFGALKSMEVTSIVLGCAHPNHFGIYSPPVMTLLQVPMRAPVGHFLHYCNELRVWGNQFLPSESAFDADRALWVFYEAAYGHKPIQQKMSSFRDAFENDEWVRHRHAQGLLGRYFSDYKPLEQARFLLDIDHNLSGRIAGCEFEARIKELVDSTKAGRIRKIRKFKDDLRESNRQSVNWGQLEAMVEYTATNRTCDVTLEELHRARTCRNRSMHMLGLSKENVAELIATTEKVPKHRTR